ncbi:uncharacterized protein [Antedon mediterranea]|uniref:uncharacterized protein isoform X2 n=1 Tax=Antedon mediterranea TaxID=105859 RepID=UPI003AF8E5D1
MSANLLKKLKKKDASHPIYSLLVASEIQQATAPDEDGDTPLHIAVSQCEVDMVHQLLYLISMSDLSIDPVNNLHQTPLHIAIITKHTELAADLIQAGADPNICDRYGNTSMHLACIHKCAPIMFALLQGISHKPQLTTKNFEGYIPLHLAVIHEDAEIVNILVHHKPNHIDHKDTKNGWTALFHAAARDVDKIIEILLLGGPDINCQSYSGNTALHIASGRGYTEVVRRLMQSGADMSMRNSHRESPAMITTNRVISNLLHGKDYRPRSPNSLSRSSGRQRLTSPSQCSSWPLTVINTNEEVYNYHGQQLTPRSSPNQNPQIVLSSATSSPAPSPYQDQSSQFMSPRMSTPSRSIQSSPVVGCSVTVETMPSVVTATSHEYSPGTAGLPKVHVLNIPSVNTSHLYSSEVLSDDPILNTSPERKNSMEIATCNTVISENEELQKSKDLSKESDSNRVPVRETSITDEEVSEITANMEMQSIYDAAKEEEAGATSLSSMEAGASSLSPKKLLNKDNVSVNCSEVSEAKISRTNEEKIECQVDTKVLVSSAETQIKENVTISSENCVKEDIDIKSMETEVKVEMSSSSQRTVVCGNNCDDKIESNAVDSIPQDTTNVCEHNDIDCKTDEQKFMSSEQIQSDCSEKNTSEENNILNVQKIETQQIEKSISQNESEVTYFLPRQNSTKTKVHISVEETAVTIERKEDEAGILKKKSVVDVKEKVDNSHITNKNFLKKHIDSEMCAIETEHSGQSELSSSNVSVTQQPDIHTPNQKEDDIPINTTIEGGSHKCDNEYSKWTISFLTETSSKRQQLSNADSSKFLERSDKHLDIPEDPNRLSRKRKSLKMTEESAESGDFDKRSRKERLLKNEGNQEKLSSDVMDFKINDVKLNSDHEITELPMEVEDETNASSSLGGREVEGGNPAIKDNVCNMTTNSQPYITLSTAQTLLSLGDSNLQKTIKKASSSNKVSPLQNLPNTDNLHAVQSLSSALESRRALNSKTTREKPVDSDGRRVSVIVYPHHEIKRPMSASDVEHQKHLKPGYLDVAIPRASSLSPRLQEPSIALYNKDVRPGFGPSYQSFSSSFEPRTQFTRTDSVYTKASIAQVHPIVPELHYMKPEHRIMTQHPVANQGHHLPHYVTGVPSVPHIITQSLQSVPQLHRIDPAGPYIISQAPLGTVPTNAAHFIHQFPPPHQIVHKLASPQRFIISETPSKVAPVFVQPSVQFGLPQTTVSQFIRGVPVICQEPGMRATFLPPTQKLPQYLNPVQPQMQRGTISQHMSSSDADQPIDLSCKTKPLDMSISKKTVAPFVVSDVDRPSSVYSPPTSAKPLAYLHLSSSSAQLIPQQPKMDDSHFPRKPVYSGYESDEPKLMIDETGHMKDTRKKQRKTGKMKHEEKE